MIRTLLKKYWIHLLLWIAMLAYFLYAPDLVNAFLTKNGKPLQTDSPIPFDSKRISYGLMSLEPYTKDGENLYNLAGWSLMFPEEGQPAGSFEREVVLRSDEEKYVFPITHVFPVANEDAPGFNVLIGEDVLKPGKYRVGLIFRDRSTGEEFFWDRPVYHIIKTPNKMQLEGKTGQ